MLRNITLAALWKVSLTSTRLYTRRPVRTVTVQAGKQQTEDTGNRETGC